MKQFWVGSTDVNFMLTEIGGWHVGSYSDLEARTAIQCALERGWVGYRMHYAQAFPEGSRAYEITDAGMERVREVYGEDVCEDANKKRQWYSDRAHLRFPMCETK